MMLGSLATFGYSDKHTGREIAWAMRVNPAAHIVDTRLTPYCSWSPVWRRKQLEIAWEDRYVWRGDWLGNIHHGQDLPIQLAHEDKGIPWIVHQLERGYTLLLLCGCLSEATCHRTLIYARVKAALGERFLEFQAGQTVQTPHGIGVIDPSFSIQIHRARNRYSVCFPHEASRFFFPHEVRPSQSTTGEVPQQLVFA